MSLVARRFVRNGAKPVRRLEGDAMADDARDAGSPAVAISEVPRRGPSDEAPERRDDANTRGVTASARDVFAVRRWHVACVVLILACAALLRAHHIGATSIWCDELLSIHLSNAHAYSVDRLPRDVLIEPVPDLMSLAAARPAWEVWAGMGGDMHPPLYYVVLRLWREVFGDSPAGLRSLSALLGTLAVLATFLAGRELAGTVAGIWAAAIGTVASTAIYYGQEARMYALVLLWAAVALALVLRIGRLGFTRRRGGALAACALAAMLTLYLSSTVLLACALYALFRFRGRDRVGTIASLVIAGVGFAVLWGPFLFGQNFHAMKSDWLKADPQGHARHVADMIFSLPLNHFGVPRQSDRALTWAFAIVYFLPALFLRKCPAILLPWLASLLIVGVPAGADLLRTTNMLEWQRYTLLLVPTVSVALAAIATRLPPRVGWAVPAALVLCGVVSLPATYGRERYDYRHSARFAEGASLAEGRRLVCLTTGNEKFNSVLLLACQYYWARPPESVVFVESVEALARLPRSTTGDDIVLMAGDRDAEMAGAPHYAYAGRATRALGVGTVINYSRTDRPTSAASRPSTQRAEP